MGDCAGREDDHGHLASEATGMPTIMTETSAAARPADRAANPVGRRDALSSLRAARPRAAFGGLGGLGNRILGRIRAHTLTASQGLTHLIQGHWHLAGSRSTPSVRS